MACWGGFCLGKDWGEGFPTYFPDTTSSGSGNTGFPHFSQNRESGVKGVPQYSQKTAD
jgi:hypothetical protein